MRPNGSHNDRRRRRLAAYRPPVALAIRIPSGPALATAIGAMVLSIGAATEPSVAESRVAAAELNLVEVYRPAAEYLVPNLAGAAFAHVPESGVRAVNRYIGAVAAGSNTRSFSATAVIVERGG